MEVSNEIVTPEMAKEWLKSSVGRFNQDLVDKYVKELEVKERPHAGPGEGKS